MDKPAVPPLAAVVLGAIQDRGQAELAKLASLAALADTLGQVLAELRAIRAQGEELLERARKP